MRRSRTTPHLGPLRQPRVLMVQGIPYDSPQGRAQSALTAIMHAAFTPLCRDGRRSRAVSRYQANCDAMRCDPQPLPRCLRHAAPGTRDSFRRFHDLRHCPDYLPAPPSEDCDRMSRWAKSTVSATLVTVTPRRAPSPGHGLRHDRTSRLLALVKFQLAGGGTSRSSTSRSCRWSTRLLARRSTTSNTAVGLARCRLSACQHRQPDGQAGCPPTLIASIEAMLSTAFELQFAFNRHTVGDDVRRQPHFTGCDQRPRVRRAEWLGFTMSRWPMLTAVVRVP